MILFKNVNSKEIFSASALNRQLYTEAKKLYDANNAILFEQFLDDYKQSQQSNYTRYNLKPIFQ